MKGSDGTTAGSLGRATPQARSTSGARWRVFLVEDQPLSREGLRSMLEATDGVCVVGAADRAADAVEQIKRLRANLVLTSVGVPGSDGLETTRRIRHEIPDATVVVITARDDDDVVVEAFRAGAAGFISKSAEQADIAEMLRSIATDGVYLRTADTSRLLAAMEARASAIEPVVLTPRERQVLELLAEGGTARHIGQQLGISERTVHTYIGSMYRKLGVTNKVGAVRAAIKLGMMSIGP